MKDVFEVKLWAETQPDGSGAPYGSRDKWNKWLSRDRDGDVFATLILPAMPYELWDAMDKLRLDDMSLLRWKIIDYHQSRYSITDQQGTILELNALAERLSDLDNTQAIAYDGLRTMESTRNKEPIPISRLIDLAYSTHCCSVMTKVKDDYGLGMFYVRKGLVPEAKGLSDAQLKLLRYEEIGQEKRRMEGGVFVKSDSNGTRGYVVQNAGLMEACQYLNMTLFQPDYALLIYVSRGYYAPPASDCREAVWLELPATPETLSATLSALGVKDWRDTVWRGLDCRAPVLSDMIHDIGVNDTFDESWMNRLNSLSQKLADMEPPELNLYKALLQINKCKNIQAAEQLIDTLDQYIFSPQFRSPIEAAVGELSVIMTEADAAMMMPYLNLQQYGEALIQRNCGALTPYGLIERKDGHPVQGMKDQPQWGGLEMR